MITMMTFIWKESFRQGSTLGQAETKKSPQERSNRYDKIIGFFTDNKITSKYMQI